MLLPKHRQLVGTSHYVAIATFYASTFISFAKLRNNSETTKYFGRFCLFCSSRAREKCKKCKLSWPPSAVNRRKCVKSKDLTITTILTFIIRSWTAYRYPSSAVTDIVIPVMPDTLEGTFGEPVHENPKQHKLHNSHSLRFDIFVYSLNDYSCIPIP